MMQLGPELTNIKAAIDSMKPLGTDSRNTFNVAASVPPCTLKRAPMRSTRSRPVCAALRCVCLGLCVCLCVCVCVSACGAGGCTRTLHWRRGGASARRTVRLPAVLAGSPDCATPPPSLLPSCPAHPCLRTPPTFPTAAPLFALLCSARPFCRSFLARSHAPPAQQCHVPARNALRLLRLGSSLWRAGQASARARCRRSAARSRRPRRTSRRPQSTTRRWRSAPRRFARASTCACIIQLSIGHYI
jgi:hypothetical protein